MGISLKDVTKLREMTGVGMMDCKNALEEAKGDFEKAVELLRKKGAATAAKRADREANQGLIVSYIHNERIGALLELNSETDFVARNESFRELAQEIAMHIAAASPLYITREEVANEVIEKEKEIETARLDGENKPKEILKKILEGKLDKYFSTVCLLEQPYVKNPDITIQDLLNEKTAAIGEKISVRRFSRFELGN
ncbi:MAG: translation elongation factor Ts [bacterium]